MPNVDRQTIELALVAIAALAVVVQTVFLIALFVVLSKAARSAHEEIEELRSSIMPIIYNTREIITRVAPKIEVVSDELTALIHSLREQTSDVQVAASEVIGRAQRISVRLDGMATSLLDNVERAAEFVTDTVAKPVRQVSGVISAVKAVVETLRDRNSSFRTRSSMGRSPIDPDYDDPGSNEKDMFV